MFLDMGMIIGKIDFSIIRKYFSNIVKNMKESLKTHLKSLYTNKSIINTYLDLEKSYLSGSVHPQDLKNGTASALHELFQPFQKACDSDPEPYNKLTSALD